MLKPLQGSLRTFYDFCGARAALCRDWRGRCANIARGRRAKAEDVTMSDLNALPSWGLAWSIDRAKC